jgi:hypothetical protein
MIREKKKQSNEKDDELRKPHRRPVANGPDRNL